MNDSSDFEVPTAAPPEPAPDAKPPEPAPDAKPPEPKLIGHRIVVEGIYFANRISKHNGQHEKEKVSYREEFTLAPGEHARAGRGQLGHILSDERLLKRLSEKDKDFRAIQTHKVVVAEDLFEKIEEPAPQK